MAEELQVEAIAPEAVEPAKRKVFNGDFFFALISLSVAYIYYMMFAIIVM